MTNITYGICNGVSTESDWPTFEEGGHINLKI